METHDLKPEPIRTDPPWVVVVGAVFGGISLLALFALVILSGLYPDFYCRSSDAFAAAFSFGVGLSASFLGGSAAARGNFGSAAAHHSISFAVGGGIAVVIITYVLVQSYDSSCDSVKVSHLQLMDNQYREGSPGTWKITQLKRQRGPYQASLAANFFVPFGFVIQNFEERAGNSLDIKVKAFIKNNDEIVWWGEKDISSRHEIENALDDLKIDRQVVEKFFGVEHSNRLLAVILHADCFVRGTVPSGDADLDVIVSDGHRGEHDVASKGFVVTEAMTPAVAGASEQQACER